MKKSQVLSVDIIIAVSVFILLFLFVMFTWNLNTNRIETMKQNVELQQLVFTAAEIIKNSEGDPKNWQDNISNLKSLGLSAGNGTLSQEKINALISINATHYEQVKKILGTVGPKYEIYLKILQHNGSTFEPIGEFGKLPKSKTVFKNERVAIIENITKIELFLWVDS